jgi:glucose-6-phosphate 1-dehydrogenase
MTLLQRAEAIEASRRAVQLSLNAWRDAEVEMYKADSQDPAGADTLLQRDGLSWLGLVP